MVVPIAQTKANKAMDIIAEMDALRGTDALEFKQRQFRSNYESLSNVDSNTYYLCQSIDHAIDGNLALSQESAFNINFDTAPLAIKLNVLNTFYLMGQLYSVSKIIPHIDIDELDSFQTASIASLCSVLGFTEISEKALIKLDKMGPRILDEYSDEEYSNIAIRHLSEVKKRNIDSKDLISYWKLFEEIIANKVAQPKLFNRSIDMHLQTDDGSNQLVVQFLDYRESISENELFEVSENIADGLADIDVPIEILTFVTSDIRYSKQENL